MEVHQYTGTLIYLDCWGSGSLALRLSWSPWFSFKVHLSTVLTWLKMFVKRAAFISMASIWPSSRVVDICFQIKGNDKCFKVTLKSFMVWEFWHYSSIFHSLSSYGVSCNMLYCNVLHFVKFISCPISYQPIWHSLEKQLSMTYIFKDM